MSCKDTGVENDEGDKGKTEECLKTLFRENKIPTQQCMAEVARLIKSTMVDIHTDPLLNQACAMDLLRYCDNVPPGEGRCKIYIIKCSYCLSESESHFIKSVISLCFSFLYLQWLPASTVN